MFVETYRREDDDSIMAGGDSTVIPYPKLTTKEYLIWNHFLPETIRIYDLASKYGHFKYIKCPLQINVLLEQEYEIRRFQKVVVLRAEIDPIAIGITSSNDMYLLARWGGAKLIPFSVLKRSYILENIWAKIFTGPNLEMTIGIGFIVFSIGVMGWLLSQIYQQLFN